MTMMATRSKATEKRKMRRRIETTTMTTTKTALPLVRITVFVFVVCHFYQQPQTSLAESLPAVPNHWYVSHEGSDDDLCGGSSASPCASLDYVIHKSSDRDVIHVQCTEADRTRSFETSSGLPPDLGKSLTFKGEGEGCRPRIVRSPQRRHRRSSGEDVLPAGGNEELAKESSEGEEDLKISYENVDFVDSRLRLSNGSLHFSGCNFVNATIGTVEQCHRIQLDVVGCRWVAAAAAEGETRFRHNHPHLSNDISCLNTNLSIVGSQLSWFVVNGNQSTSVFVSGSEFVGKSDGTQRLGGLHLKFGALDSTIVIRNSTFLRQYHPSKVRSIINLYESALWLKSVPVRRGSNESNANATIDGCRLVDNERGLTLIGPFRALVVRNCLFEGNRAMHSGAAVLVLVNSRSPVAIDNCSFASNVAGRYRETTSPSSPTDSDEEEDDAGALTTVGDEVHLNTSCCKGVIMLVGKGGAVRIQRGYVELTNSRFTDNVARLLGSSVFVDIDGFLLIRNTYFENTDRHDHALQGEVLFSDGNVEMNTVTIKVRTAVNGLSIVRHSGQYWSLEIANVWIQCPVGYDLRATNSSAYGVKKDGLHRSHFLDQLSYFCESCPRNKYSLDFGYLNYTMVFKVFAYFTLLINGSAPQAQYTGSYDHHEIQCKECPYGGQCVEDISAVSNYWGFVTSNNSVSFQHCPHGYCCAANSCSAIDACAPLRRGRLCGRCAEGYSEAWFTTACVPNDACSPPWLLPTSVALGLSYAVFLMHQTDLKRFIFAGPRIVGCRSSAQSRRRSVRRSRSKTDHFAPPPHHHHHLVLDHGINDCVPSSTTAATVFNGDSETRFYRHCHHNNTSERFSSRQAPDLARSVDFGCIVTFVYYYQDALLLNVKTTILYPENRIVSFARSILSGFFKFELNLLELLHTTCALPDMTAVPKTVSQVVLIPFMLSVFGAVYLSAQVFRYVCGDTKSPRVPAKSTDGFSARRRDSFSSPSSVDARLVSGTILALLFTYQTIASTTFTLLNCVPADNEQVLFVDGTIVCYQYWQYGLMAYAVVCVVPFCLVLMAGPTLLQSERISLRQFLCACLCPLPFLSWWAITWIRHREPKGGGREGGGGGGGADAQQVGPGSLTDGAVMAIQLLQGPFKENPLGMCWSGVLVGRRLVLVLLFSFVNDALLRLLSMLLTCSVILLHHVDVQPYRDTAGNVAGTVAASALVTLSVVNLVRAAFQAAEYHPTGPNALLMRVFAELETVLLVWTPVAVVVAVAGVGMLRFVALVASPMRRGGQTNRRQEPKDQPTGMMPY